MTQAVVSAVSETTKQGAEADRREWWWAEASIWTERMVSALVDGVKGGKPNAFFADHGLFTLSAAHEMARHSR